MSWAIRNALPVPVLGARRRKLPTGRSLRQLTEARLRLRRSQALDPLVAPGTLARPHFTSMRAPKQVQGSMDGPGAGRLNSARLALAHARLSGATSWVGGDEKQHEIGKSHARVPDWKKDEKT